jgi:hypothetical protein
VHVSFGPEAKREVIEIEERHGRRIPRRRAPQSNKLRLRLPA